MDLSSQKDPGTIPLQSVPPQNTPPQAPYVINSGPQGNQPPPPGQYVHNPLIQQQGAYTGAAPRPYQNPTWSSRNGYLGNQKRAYVGFALFALFAIVVITISSIMYFNHQRKVVEARKRQEEFHESG